MTDYGLYAILLVVLIVTYLQRSINNLVGPVRDKFGQKVVLYATIRDVKGALFLATVATLTSERGNTV